MQSEELQSLVRQLSLSAGSGNLPPAQSLHRFRDCVDELSDLLYYIQDIYALGIAELAVAMSSNLLDKLALFVAALSSSNVASSAVSASSSSSSPSPPASGSSLQPCVALYVLGQLFFVLKEPQLVHALAALLLAAPGK